jgi:hypothetical protein
VRRLIAGVGRPLRQQCHEGSARDSRVGRREFHLDISTAQEAGLELTLLLEFKNFPAAADDPLFYEREVSQEWREMAPDRRG